MPKNILDIVSGIVHERRVKKLYDAYCLVDRDEQRARLTTIMALSVELHKIQEQDIFSTRLGEVPIESILEGDWEYAATYVSHFTFEGEGPEAAAKYGALWEPYRTLLHTAVVEARRRKATPVTIERSGGN